MFEYLEKILKSEDLFPSLDIDFSKIEESILSFGDVFSEDTISNLESLSLLKIESIDELPEKILEYNAQIPESEIQKIIEYIKTDPVLIERISEGINIVDLIEIIKEKKDLIFSSGDSIIMNTVSEKLLETENNIFQKIKEFIPTEYFEKIISNTDTNTIESIKNDLTTQLQQVFENKSEFANINFENISNTYFQDIINNIESTNIQKSFFNDFENVNLPITNIQNTIENVNPIENITQEISNIFNEITEIFKNTDNTNIQNIQNTENISDVNISNIQGSTYNESILEGSTYNEYLSTLNINNINSEISNLYNEIQKTNEYIANADFTQNENTNIFDETIINSLTTKFMNKENTEIIEVKEIINNLHEKILETHHEIEVLKEENAQKPNVQEVTTNLQIAETSNNTKINKNSNTKLIPEEIRKSYPIQRIPAPLPQFPNIGQFFLNV